MRLKGKAIKVAIKAIMAFVYGLINALHNQKLLVSFGENPMMRMASLDPCFSLIIQPTHADKVA
jgi:hypothetical protein